VVRGTEFGEEVGEGKGRVEMGRAWQRCGGGGRQGAAAVPRRPVVRWESAWSKEIGECTVPRGPVVGWKGAWSKEIDECAWFEV
jgi:hypothetical protein